MSCSLYSCTFSNFAIFILFLRRPIAGKTSILYKLQIGEVITTVPTIGFNVESVKYKNLEFQVLVLFIVLSILGRYDINHMVQFLFLFISIAGTWVANLAFGHTGGVIMKTLKRSSF